MPSLREQSVWLAQVRPLAGGMPPQRPYGDASLSSPYGSLRWPTSLTGARDATSHPGLEVDLVEQADHVDIGVSPELSFNLLRRHLPGLDNHPISTRMPVHPLMHASSSFTRGRTRTHIPCEHRYQGKVSVPLT